MIKLALLRHGHTEWNRAGRIQGRTDIPLDDEAIADLSGLRLPAPWDGADLWSSPLKRAVETARLVAQKEPETDAALMEMDWGDWEGRESKVILEEPDSGFRHIEEWGWNYTPPDGESPADLRDRLVPWAQELKRDTVAVCHIGVMRVLLARAYDWKFEGTPPFKIKRNRLFVIEISPNYWRAIAEPVRLEARTT